MFVAWLHTLANTVRIERSDIDHVDPELYGDFCLGK
jgi:hypothetical protein